MAEKNKNYEILEKLLKDLPPMVNEPNQKEIDAEAARILREAAAARKAADDIEKFLRS